MRQLRQASSQGYNLLGRSHDNINGALSSPRYYQPHLGSTTLRRDPPLRRYASAQTLPHSTAFYPGYQQQQQQPVVYRISGDFDGMWDRQHQQTVHKPVFGRGIIAHCSYYINSVKFSVRSSMHVIRLPPQQVDYHAHPSVATTLPFRHLSGCYLYQTRKTLPF